MCIRHIHVVHHRVALGFRTARLGTLRRLLEGRGRPRQANQCNAHGFGDGAEGTIRTDGLEIGHRGIVVRIVRGIPFEIGFAQVEQLVVALVALDRFALGFDALDKSLRVVDGTLGHHDGLSRLDRMVRSAAREIHHAVATIILADEVVAGGEFQDDTRVDLVRHQREAVEIERLLRGIVDRNILVVVVTRVGTGHLVGRKVALDGVAGIEHLLNNEVVDLRL